MRDTFIDAEGALREKETPSFALQWYSAHLGPSLDTIFDSAGSEVFKPSVSGPAAGLKKVHFTIVNPSTPRARVVLVNPKDFNRYRILTMRAALDLMPMALRPTGTEHVLLNKLLDKIAHLLT